MVNEVAHAPNSPKPFVGTRLDGARGAHLRFCHVVVVGGTVRNKVQANDILVWHPLMPKRRRKQPTNNAGSNPATQISLRTNTNESSRNLNRRGGEGGR